MRKNLMLDLKVELLFYMRDLYYKGAPRNAKIDLDLDEVAKHLKIPRELLPGLLKDLLVTGLIVPNQEATHLAYTDGRAEISPQGLKFLHDWEAAHRDDSVLKLKPRPGFRIPDSEDDDATASEQNTA